MDVPAGSCKVAVTPPVASVEADVGIETRLTVEVQPCGMVVCLDILRLGIVSRCHLVPVDIIPRVVLIDRHSVDGIELLYHTERRADERTVSYAECHDQALVGDKTLAFRLMDKEMYYGMSVDSRNLMIDRGIALHKMIRLVTLAANGGGYLNFMGNEFGHPEWIDFPREGNGWSYKYARRQWNLADDPALRYSQLEAFDAAMIHFWTRSGSTEIPELLYIHEDRQVLIFRRKNCIFTFNFSPCGSYENLRFTARNGRYRMVLNTDARQFGGFGRLKEREEHSTVNGELALYVPSRCAMVLEFQQEQTAGTEKKK